MSSTTQIEEYNQQERARDEFFDMMEKSANSVNLSEEEAQTIITDVVQVVRTKNNVKL